MNAVAHPGLLRQAPWTSSIALPRISRAGIGWAALLVGIAAAIALPQPEHLAIGVATLTVVTLVLAKPVAAVPLLLVSVPFGSLAEIEAGDFSISPTEPLVALIALAWLARGIARKQIVLRGGGVLGAALVMATLALFSITYAESRGLATKETLKWLELIVVLLVTLDLARSERTARVLLGWLFAAGSVEALWGVVQVATGAGPSGFNVGDQLRAFGNFDQPNPFAGYLAMTLPLALLMAATPANSARFRLYSLACSGALTGGILLSQSRGALLGLGAAWFVVMLVWAGWSRRLLLPLTYAGGTLALMLAAGLVPGGWFDRLLQAVEYFGVFDVRTVQVTSENWAVVERMAHWQAGWYMFLDHHWLGVAAGNYPEAYPNYYLTDWVEPLGHAHNYYLNTAAELGLVGFSLLLVFLGFVFRGVWRAVRETGASGAWFWRAVAVGVLGSLIVFCTHDIFDNLFVHSVNVQLGFLIGLALVAGQHGAPAKPLPAVNES